MLTILFVGALTFSRVLGTSLQYRRDLVLHEQLDVAPAEYQIVQPAPSDHLVNLRLALTQSDLSGLIDALYDVSAPSSTKYGQHLSKAEAEVFAAPKPETLSSVTSWLDANGLNATALSPAGDWLGLQLPVSQANDLLAANYSIFEHQTTGKQVIRTLSYSIPVSLKGHLDFVYPTVSFPDGSSKVPPPSSSAVLTSPSSATETTPCGPIGTTPVTPPISPACLQYLYYIPTTPATNPSNKLAVTGYDSLYANEADLQQFLGEFRPDMNSSIKFSVETVDGGVNPQNRSQAGEEANIDTQWTVGIATDVPVTFISVGDTDDGIQTWLDTVNYLLAQDSPPQVVSTSYGWDESAVPFSIANNLCNAYAQLGARGVSILFSSGDGGVSGTGYSDCTTFVPTFPSGCPYVTSVGGTTVLPTQEASPFSSGGFSNYWSTPSYQATAVADYLKLLGSNETGLYNASGRGFPDISAYSVRFQTVVNGTVTEPVGTSLSTPLWASIIALLNDELLNSGRPVLGFLNPWLYSSGANAVTDITAGNNIACSPDGGFEATTGWDPVTGLGVPNYTKLKATLNL